ncbi:MAG: tRNA pseudouridine(55) synthase TruB [Pyrinomonadaceae bacterium]
MDGILIIDKPDGFTSHDVVARCRKILKTKRIGHTGTLDPFATGVMVILVGRATRLAQFLDKEAKEYEAQIRFGFETSTGDLTGTRNAERGTRNQEIVEILSETNWENVFAKFRGEIWQTPPMYSAKKVAGKKLYELARKGIEIERKPVAVKIYELELLEEIRTPHFALRVRVVCSAGTYIRALAEDIGRELKIGAHLTALRRTRAGKFDLSQSVTLEKLEKIVAENKLDETLISTRDALAHLPEKILAAEEILQVKHGMKLKFISDEINNNETIRLTDENENLVAVGFYDDEKKVIQPKIVLV